MAGCLIWLGGQCEGCEKCWNCGNRQLFQHDSKIVPPGMRECWVPHS
jgi:hypothetical protein